MGVVARRRQAAWERRWYLGVQMPVQAAALQDWSTRCGIEWSIPAEQQIDRSPAPSEDKRQIYGPVRMTG
jgi:hypothetical protein